MNKLSDEKKICQQINIQRLMSDIERYSIYGKNDQGGVTRPSFSKADHEIREIFINEMKDLGLEIEIDGAANIWARKKGNGKKTGSVVIGSHLDSVPNGGKYDGPLGVLMAKEIAKTIIENDISMQHDLEVVSFTAEESNDFNLSTFGSRSFVGKITAEMLKDISDSSGNQIREELTKVGGGLNRYHLMGNTWHDKKVFVELHIEQGKRLETNDISMAVIDKVVGTYRSNIKVTGQSNHSGTTMMGCRQDALTAAAEMVLEVERECRESGGNIVGTVGQLNVSPNAANIIPGQVNFILELRGKEEQEIQKVLKKIQKVWEGIGVGRKVKIEQDVFLDQKPVKLDENVVNILEKTANQLEEPYLILPSMAVHDAAHMAAVTKSAMIFVKSIDGRSHCPEEYSLPTDIQKAGNLMLHGIINLDKELS